MIANLHPGGGATQAVGDFVATLFQRRGQRDGLEGGAGSVDLLDGAIDEGLADIGEVEVVLLLGNAVNDVVCVNPRIRRHRQDMPAARIERDHRARLNPERCLGQLLHPHIKRQADIAAGNRRPVRDLADRTSLRVDDHKVTATAAGERPFERLFDAVAADHVAGAVALDKQLFQFGWIDLLEVPDDMRGEITVGVVAPRLAADQDAH